MAYEGRPDLSVERQFEVYEIHWSVRDLSLLTCGVDWSLQSPVFAVRGCHVTKWSISLRPVSDEPDLVALILKRCEADGGPDRVRAEWKMTVHVSSREIFARGRSFVFTAGVWYDEKLETLKSSIEAIRSFDSDHMTIRCKMMVFYDGDRKEVSFEPSADPAMAKLSEDLSDLFHGGAAADCDLRLRIGKRSISAHKAVACARIPLLNRLLEGSEVVAEGDRKVDVVDVSFLDHDTALRIVEYAYSGDLAHVLEEPSLAMFESVHSLDIHHLKNVYSAKELHFRTLLAVQETKFTWTKVDFFEESRNTLTSPQFTDELSGGIWQLRIFGGENGYFSVSAEHSGAELGAHLCVEFSVADEHGRSVFSKLLRRQAAEGGPTRVRADEFIRRSTLRALLVGSALRLTFKVKLMSKDLHPTLSYVERREMSAVSNRRTDSFRLLSLEMLESLEVSNFADARLRCQWRSFGVDRCIVGARCGYLLNLINNDEKDEDGCVVVRDIKFDVLYSLVKYIYGGVIPEHRDQVLELLDMALWFRLPLLEEICEEMMARVDNR